MIQRLFFKWGYQYWLNRKLFLLLLLNPFTLFFFYKKFFNLIFDLLKWLIDHLMRGWVILLLRNHLFVWKKFFLFVLQCNNFLLWLFWKFVQSFVCIFGSCCYFDVYKVRVCLNALVEWPEIGWLWWLNCGLLKGFFFWQQFEQFFCLITNIFGCYRVWIGFFY